MTRQDPRKRKVYLYAIAPELNGASFGPIGLDGGAVYAITNGRVSAVVSDVPEKIRPERRQLAAHQEVLKRLILDATAVLPVAFGVVADDSAAIRKILASHQKPFLEQLRRVAGRVEMGLRVTWDVPNIFEYFVQTHPELRVARDRFFGGHREPTQDDKIELGRLFDRLLTEDREAHTERVVEMLTPSCVEIKPNKPRTEREVVNVACLIGRDGREPFEAAVFEAAKLFDNHYAFDYNGPWAPHNFVDLTLDL
ncbi:MAG: GvpL/GvpF family gas vesicle protein [Candidatus Rokubacteria bacterium]|nr:GvpL/GvpF family gas vesicle protein [Candidatus Rokubacteria bacterium]